MSAILTKYYGPSNTEVFVWSIRESADYYLKRLDLNPDQLEKINEYPDHRKLEFCASRYFMMQSFGHQHFDDVAKDDHGKPYMSDMDIEIGISHTSNTIALIKSDVRVGIDIERMDRKIHKIAHKFLSDTETKARAQYPDQLYLTAIWTAKEAMYKAYGKKKLEFATEMNVEIQKLEDTFDAKGIITKNQQTEKYELHYQNMDDKLLCWAILSECL